MRGAARSVRRRSSGPRRRWRKTGRSQTLIGKESVAGIVAMWNRSRYHPWQRTMQGSPPGGLGAGVEIPQPPRPPPPPPPRSCRASKRGRPHRTRCSHCTDSAATSGRGPNRNRSQGVNGRGGRNVCMARLRACCARGAGPAVAARGWADSAGRALTWQPPRGEAGRSTASMWCLAMPSALVPARCRRQTRLAATMTSRRGTCWALPRRFPLGTSTSAFIVTPSGPDSAKLRWLRGG